MRPARIKDLKRLSLQLDVFSTAFTACPVPSKPRNRAATHAVTARHPRLLIHIISKKCHATMSAKMMSRCKTRRLP